MEPHRAEPETIAGGGDGDGRPPFVASRSLIVATAWGLAVCLVGSAGLAVHYHRQLIDVRKRVSSVSPAATLTESASAGPLLTPIVVESQQQQPALAAPASPAVSAPASSASPVPFTDIASSVTSVLAAPLSSFGYVLSTGALHTTVYLTTAGFRGAGSTEQELQVSALILGAPAGTSYQLIGGSCEDTATDTVWAQGVADTSGSAYLVGQSRTLDDGTPYFLTLDPAPATKPPRSAGLEGIFALGQAVPFVGHVIRDQGVTGGQCAIGP